MQFHAATVPCPGFPVDTGRRRLVAATRAACGRGVLRPLEETMPRASARYVALLRAINVGGHIVKMEHLRAHFEALGFARVQTVIASGNVIFDAAPGDASAMESRIEQQLQSMLGYAVATFLRTPVELAAVAAHQPFPGTETGSAANPLHVAFTRRAVAPDAVRSLLAARSKIDDFHVEGREVYWVRRTMLGESKFTGARLEKIIGMPATARNITTVRKLAMLTDAG